MDGGSIYAHLTAVRDFLEANPHEVVTLLFVNVGVPIQHWAKAFYETGLDQISYLPPSNKRYGNMRISDWPTIEEMVQANQRLVTFISSGAQENDVPFLLSEITYTFSTPFGIEAPDQYSCWPARPWWERDNIPDRLSIVNHFLYAKFFGKTIRISPLVNRY
jgi:hypothetical protein